MGTPRALSWRRSEAYGGEVAIVDDAAGLAAKGWAIGATYHCEYVLRTDELWRTISLDVTTEGAGWQRTLSLQRRSTGWRVRASERGELKAPPPGIESVSSLDKAIDVDLGFSPLTNTLPVRRLRLQSAEPGARHDLLMAWVGVPALFVLPDPQRYEAAGPDRVRYRSDRYETAISLDAAGYVLDYPGVGHRA